MSRMSNLPNLSGPVSRLNIKERLTRVTSFATSPAARSMTRVLWRSLTPLQTNVNPGPLAWVLRSANGPRRSKESRDEQSQYTQTKPDHAGTRSIFDVD